MKSNNSIGTIAKSIKELNAKVEGVEFHTLDGAIIPQSELLRHRNNIPFVMTIRRKGEERGLRYAVNLNLGFSISNKNEAKTGEEKYLEYCLGIGLP